MEKDKVITIRLSEEKRQALQRAAHEDVRSLSSLVEKWLTDRLIDEGYLKRKEDQ